MSAPSNGKPDENGSESGKRKRMNGWNAREAGAFTLIELLAVVAVLGVLTALALNAAMGAKIRSEVARVHVEFGQLAAALETYRFDHGEWPRQDGVNRPLTPPPRFVDDMRELTTPVAYCAVLPEGPWHGRNLHLKNSPLDGYRRERIFRRSGNRAGDDWTRAPDYRWARGNGFYLHGFPPGAGWTLGSYGPAQIVTNRYYNPSNGIVSLGGVFLVGGHGG